MDYLEELKIQKEISNIEQQNELQEIPQIHVDEEENELLEHLEPLKIAKDPSFFNQDLENNKVFNREIGSSINQP